MALNVHLSLLLLAYLLGVPLAEPADPAVVDEVAGRLAELDQSPPTR